MHRVDGDCCEIVGGCKDDSGKAPAGLIVSRSFTTNELGDLFDKVLVDSSFFGERDVTDVGDDCALRTYGIEYCGGDGFKVFADTKYFIEVRGHEVYVDGNALGNLIANYESGGVDAAVAYLDWHFANEKEAQ